LLFALYTPEFRNEYRNVIQRDQIRVELQALPDKDEWILNATFSIERGAKILREPDKTLDVEIANASAALKEMIFAQLYADLKKDVADILRFDHADLEQARDMKVALDRLHRKLQ